MHPNEIDLTKFSEPELMTLKHSILDTLSEARLAALEEQLKRQTESKSK